ncbi:hypothetical protein J4Q44_G00347560 [Coregonus suidteri]|uniref:Uncharacterized protein n=1 Tax=Coregonus suidteri TaxID=861788 RepID=A0AAN8KUF8_9TELE
MCPLIHWHIECFPSKHFKSCPALVKPLNTSTHTSYPHSITAVIPFQHFLCHRSWSDIGVSLDQLQKRDYRTRGDRWDMVRATLGGLRAQDTGRRAGSTGSARNTMFPYRYPATQVEHSGRSAIAICHVDS